MKTIRFILLFVSSVILPFSAYSQNCNSCTTDTTLSTPGFIGINAIPCIVQGVPYSYTIPLHMYTNIVEFGDTLSVDSVRILDIENLPCGLCWNTIDPPLNTLVPNQNGCISITGTTLDSAGQFKLAIYMYGYFGGVSKAILPTTLDTDGIELILRVISPTGSCLPVDTSANAKNLTTSNTACATGVNDMQGYVSQFNVYPNPVNAATVVSFTALQSGTYTLKLNDVTGKIISIQQLQPHAGINTTGLPGQNLPSGIYFISIGDEQGTITKKLLVTE